MRDMLTIVVAAVLVLCAAPALLAAEHEDAEKLTGEVLMLTPAVMSVGTDSGTIEQLEITADSVVDPNVVVGNRAVVWYRDTAGGSKVVVRTAMGQGAAPTGAGERPTEQQPAQAGARTERQGTATSAGTAGAGTAAGGGERDTPSYDEVVGSPDDVMLSRPGRTSLPQTASWVPVIGATGLAALIAALALTVLLRDRS